MVDTSLTSYQSFLESKRVSAPSVGFDVPISRLNRHLFNWQADTVQWALRRGRAAFFWDCGLGKTLAQLAWSEQVWKRTGKPVLILAPILVGWQTLEQAERFAVDAPIRICQDHSQIGEGINVTNYERLHLFDSKPFAGVVLDEGSILKNFMGKRKRAIIEMFAHTPYKLSCTATPAPNDLLELGNQADFLGVMPANEMIARWFINDTMHAGNYRLKNHGAADFWRWVSSWSVFLSSPADLGHPDDGFHLPSLNLIEQVVASTDSWFGGDSNKSSATNIHKEKRSSLGPRCDVIADLVRNSTEQWAIWCGTNYEADAIMYRIGSQAVEIRGSSSEKWKETALKKFQHGESRAIVTKSKVAGFGLNWQHCHNTTWFAGYSFEEFYQAIRRLYRFGQTHPVNCHVIATVKTNWRL